MEEIYYQIPPCPSCGGRTELLKDGKTLRCVYCKTEYPSRLPLSNEHFVKYQLASAQIQNAEYSLALDTLQQVVAENPGFSLAWWQMLRADYGVKIEEGKITCHYASDKNVQDNEYYKKALECMDSEEGKEKLIQEAQDIERIRKEIIHRLSDGDKYDVFICFKAEDAEHKKTEDYQFAYNVYRKLTDAGYMVFFCSGNIK